MLNLIILCAAAVGAIFGAVMFSKHPVFVLYLTTVVMLISWDFPQLPGTIVGGFTVYPEDVVAVICSISTVINVHRRAGMLDAVVSLLGLYFVGSIVFEVLAGFLQYGSASVVESRSIFQAIAVASWALTTDWRPILGGRRLAKWSMVSISGACLVALYHMMVYGLGQSDSFVTSTISGVEQTGRPLTAAQALSVALFWLFLLQKKDKSHFRLLMLASGAVVIVLSQQRSAWLAVAAGLVFLAVLSSSTQRTRFFLSAILTAFLLGLVAVMGLFSDIATKVLASAEDVRTIDDRELGWNQLLSDALQGGPLRILFGEPFGAGWARDSASAEVDYAPHNWYLTLFLRIGIVGLVALILFIGVALWRALRCRDALAVSLIVSTLIFCWTYSLPMVAAPIFGFAFTFGRYRLMGARPDVQAGLRAGESV